MKIREWITNHSCFIQFSFFIFTQQVWDLQYAYACFKTCGYVLSTLNGIFNTPYNWRKLASIASHLIAFSKRLYLPSGYHIVLPRCVLSVIAIRTQKQIILSMDFKQAKGLDTHYTIRPLTVECPDAKTLMHLNLNTDYGSGVPSLFINDTFI